MVASNTSTSTPATAVAPPAHLCCPITHELFRDPVIDQDGNTFEREAIVRWLTLHGGTNPTTRRQMSPAELVPNRSMRDAVEEFARNNNISVPAVGDSAPPTAGDANADADVSLLSDVTASAVMSKDGSQVVLSVVPPTSTTAQKNTSVDVVCVIDISGSMDASATVQDENGNKETHGLSVLDVVKHAALTVGCMLDENDRVAIVTFSNSARVDFGLTAMDDDGKKELKKTLENIRTEGMTNLWDGLHTGMELLRKRSDDSRLGSLLLLTDGQPNVDPPRGHLPTLRRYLDEFSPSDGAGAPPPFTINTFGFGYNLDSKLLADVAQEGSGMYVFIPDSGLVGTVFVNVIANVRTTIATHVVLSVEMSSASAAFSSSGQHPLLNVTPTGVNGRVGTLQLGQSRDFHLTIDNKTDEDTSSAFVADPSAFFAKVVLHGCGGATKTLTCAATTCCSKEQEDMLVVHGMRNEFARNVLAMVHNMNSDHGRNRGAAPPIPSSWKRSGSSPLPVGPVHLVDFLSTLHAGKSKLQQAAPTNRKLLALAEGLHFDASGEVKMALSKSEDFSRWGTHYLPSLVRANVLQQCNNFKDHSVQCYGGASFAAARDAGEKIFTSLPPPTPSNRVIRGGRGYNPALGRGGAGRAPPPVQMATYYNMSGGCITADSRVSLQHDNDDGVSHPRTAPACEVRRGDVLKGGAQVLLVAKIATRNGSADIIRFTATSNNNNNETAAAAGTEPVLGLTEYHPVSLDGGASWHFPVELVHGDDDGASSAAAAGCGKKITRHPAEPHDFVYAFVLSPGHASVDVGGISVIALGHGIREEESAVAHHDYLGTTNVVRDLAALYHTQQAAKCDHDQDDGVVVVPGFTRDPRTNRINGITPLADFSSQPSFTPASKPVISS